MRTFNCEIFRPATLHAAEIDGRRKAWWSEVDKVFVEELRNLGTGSYRWKEAEPMTIRLTAHDRFRPT